MPLRSFSPAEMVLSDRQRLERPLMLMIWLAIVALSLAEGNLFYLLAGTAAVAVNFVATMRDKEIYVSRLVVNVGVLLATVLMLLEVARGIDPLLITLAHYIVLIQLCKLFERKRNRDYVQLLLLSLLTMVAGGLITAQLWFAMVLVVYLGLTCHVAMIFTLKRGLDRALAARLSGEAAPLDADRVAWNVVRQWPRKPLRKLLVGLVITLLISGAAMFVFMPRVSALTVGALGRLQFGPEGGLADVHLGDTSEIYLSGRVVMHVTVEHAPDGGTGRLPPELTYMRGQVFNVYDNSGWRHGDQNRRDVTAPSYPRGLTQDDYRLHVAMSRSLLPDVFSPYPTIRVQSGAGSMDIGLFGQPELRSRSMGGGALSYRVWTWARPLNDQQVRFLWESRSIHPMLHRFPRWGVRVTPRVARLAQNWAGDLVTRRTEARRRGDFAEIDRLNLAIAQVLATRLGQRCTYTLDLSEADRTRDGVEDFLFHMRKGHCEYFASALTVMCRELGVPARLATGFVMSEYEPQSRRYVVRARHAHAWTEVYTPSTDWRIVDATPPGGRESAVDRAWYAGLSEFWSEMQFLWNTHVVSYDGRAYDAYMHRVGNWAYDSGLGLTDWFERTYRAFVDWLVHGRPLAMLVRAVLVVAVLVFVVDVIWLMARFWRRRRNRLGAFADLPYREAGYLWQLLRLLRKRRVPIDPRRTLAETAELAQAQLALPVGQFDPCVDAYYQLRWSPHRPTDAQVRGADRAVEEAWQILRSRSRDQRAVAKDRPGG